MNDFKWNTETKKALGDSVKVYIIKNKIQDRLFWLNYIYIYIFQKASSKDKIFK